MQCPTFMKNSEYFDLAFNEAKKITPYLSGRLANSVLPNDDCSIHISHDNSDAVRALYEHLIETSKEAGHAYWLTRTWHLLCWQPIYLAFIFVYRVKAIPDITSISQSIQPGFIAGFSFHNAELIFGLNEKIIPLIGTQLKRLFTSYREDISTWIRIRPGFTDHLVADALLNCIIKLQTYQPALSNEYLLQQATLWLDAFELSNSHLSSLKVVHLTNRLKLVRTSCCLVYKCDGRKLCLDCPRHPDNKR